MFKRKYRLGKEVDFYNSRAFSSPFFTMKVKDNGMLYNRFLAIVSKKTEKKAVGRNRLKRVLVSCLGELQKQLLQGHDFLFIIKKEAKDKPRNRVYEATEEVFKKGGLLV